MIAPLTHAICLHAQSADLEFLNSVRNMLCKLLGSNIIVCKLSAPSSHSEAIKILKSATDGLVVVLAHGTDAYLRGGEYRNGMSGELCEVEKILTRTDLDAFKGKVIFCLSCNSNGLAQDSIDVGALAFVGFDSVPFNRFDETGNPIGTHALVTHCQTLLADAVKASIARFVSGRATLNESVDYLRLWINQKAIAFVRENDGVKERREVAALFLRIGQGVRYHGPLGIRFEISEPGE
jgi:hypothetical protein